MKTLQPTVLRRANIWLDSDYKISRIQRTNLSVSTYKGKMVMIDMANRPDNNLGNSYTHPKSYVSSECEPFLFVAPECSFSRDALRGSGFKLVRDYERSNVIVLPDIQMCFESTYDLLVEFENVLYIARIVNKDDIAFDSNKLETLKVQSELHFRNDYSGEFKTIHFASGFEAKKLFTVNRCDMYEKIYCSDPIRHGFCFESNMRISPTLEINPELFAIWRKCTSRDVIQCAVQQIDWQKYPATIMWFLRQYDPYIYVGANNYLKKILDEIGFFQFKDKGKLDKVITPEDWNMLQKCELYNLGISENGGFVNVDAKVPDCLRAKVAVKPIYIDEPQNFDDLMQAVKI